MLKIALTGSTGLIGSRIMELLDNEFEFIEILQSQIDITNKIQITEAINNIDFDIFLHLAGFTNVDGAENDKSITYKVNVEGTKNVFDAITAKNKKFIYVSTDFVFDGNNPPYYEDSQVNPLSYYAQTKYEGERIVTGNAMIVRLSYPYRTSYDLKKDFVKGIITSLNEKKQLTMVTDSLITPTFIDDIAYSFKYLFNNFSNEIYHIIGSDSYSPYDAGKIIAKIFKLDESLIAPVTFSKYYQNKAKRPQYSEIKTKKNNFYKMKTFEEGLAEVVLQLRNF